MQTYYTAMNDINYANNTCIKVHIICKHSQQSTHGYVNSVIESGYDRNIIEVRHIRIPCLAFCSGNTRLKKDGGSIKYIGHNHTLIGSKFVKFLT